MALRAPGEDYGDAIIRLARAEVDATQGAALTGSDS
jgi:hypothetical protein